MPSDVAPNLSRRDALLLGGSLIAGLATSPPSTFAADASKPGDARKPTFTYCLNTSTIRGQKLGIEKEIDIAAQAGYDGIEPWLRTITEYTNNGGSLKELRKRLDDHGLKVESAIGFANWIVDNEAQREAGFREATHDMEVIAELGGTRIAAPPAGVPRGQSVDLDRAAERYHQLLELGEPLGVTPQVEMWGGNATIGTLSQAIYVAIRSRHPKACFLGDVYHTYKGGSEFASLRLLGPESLQVFHMNDYPAVPPRATIKDKDRIYPGDGIAPMDEILQGFLAVGATPVLSLELFNPDYWKQDALYVAQTGLQKMKACVASATG
ncbi:Inosose isomerase [Planctomycetes bacterium Pan216]|uniref:Inosose isomerase n=1 Tax=Kolteria novifilia TaxID=2527975 RepID=A0A518B483_9BACT|nr:Inosose isomerase [Planctomycetes bacterium Pan216]